MRKAVWAVYFHIRSSDEEPLHSFCPVGPNSWCKYQNQVVEGSVETFRHSNKLPVAVMDAIKPVFNDLSQPKLLQKCLGGKTKNNNESINSLIWKLCPKTLGCGRKIVDISTNEAIVIFNDGNQGRLKIMQSLGLTFGQFAHKFVTLVDIKRIQTAEIHFNLHTKEVCDPLRRYFGPEDGGIVTQIKGNNVDNLWVVPYNPVLSRTFNAHINVEFCNSVKSIKYICKYVNKGTDQATFSVEDQDEVTRKRTKSLFYRRDNVIHKIINPQKTTLMAFFELCQVDNFAKTLLYCEVPAYYVWKNSKFYRRKKGKTVSGYPEIKKD
ncbi:uncharacterized protein TNCV_396051 [Trichonephila clavipes]|nr:uncharacterized protein TNCV_396051 [Trichonephila clavipes]